MSLRSTAARLHLPFPHFVWFAVSFAGLLAMLLTRLLRYHVWTLPGPLDDLLGVILSYEALLFFGVWIVGSFFAKLLLIPLVLAAAAFRKRLLVSFDGRYGLRPALHSLAWTGMVLGHAAFDLHPLLAGLSFTSLPLLHPRIRAAAGRRRLVRASLWLIAVVVLLYVWRTDGLSGFLALGLWGIALRWLVRSAPRHVIPRDRLGMAFAAVALAQLASAWGPLYLPAHGGTVLADRMAYGFCEIEERHRLFAASTNCPTLPDLLSGREACREGVVSEYDLDSLELIASHSFFSDRFYGRLEQVLCLDDRVLVGLNGVVIDGEESRDSALEFEADQPQSFRAHIAGTHIGHRLAYDEKRRAVILVPEWGSGIARYELATGSARRVFLERPIGFERLVARKDSLELGPQSIHRLRDSIFLAEWIAGRAVLELSLDTLQGKARYPLNDGGSVGVTVDEELNRMYVGGLWGFSAWDLDTGRVIRRTRLGLLNRYPVIDEAHGLVLVPSTVTGRIYVIDRETLATLGVIPIGFGVRLAHLSSKISRFFASSARKAFYWSTDEIAEAFRPSGGGAKR